MSIRNRIIITSHQDKIVLLMLENEKIMDIVAGEYQSKSADVGDVFVGKVQNVVNNINAAFVEIQKNVIGFLPLSECMDKKIKCGDELVVQIKKAAVKTKQPVLTVFPEIVGRYFVISTKSGPKSISKKIESQSRREELQKILSRFEKESYEIILRTGAQTADNTEILTEGMTLLQEMHNMMEQGLHRTCFSRIRKESPFYIKYMQGCRLEDFECVMTDLPEVYEELHRLYGDYVQLYNDKSYSLDNLFGISSKLKKFHDKNVWLKSGGNLVIEITEALTVIDVNTGKAVDGKRKKETTFFKINCEAALESARQIRIRNLSGIILIDFIDMKEKDNVQKLMQLLQKELAKDKIRTTLVDITKLGLVEITRMKKNPPLHEVFPRKI